MKAVLLLLLVSCLGGALSYAQTTPNKRGGGRELLGSNVEGTHFFVGFMENEIPECDPGNNQLRLSIASRFAATVTITKFDGVVTLELQPSQLRSISVSRDLECIGEGVFPNAIEITSTAPVSVYGYSSKTTTSDGYLALPVSAWGKEYVTANYTVDTYDPDDSTVFICYDAPRGGEFAIIASEDNTEVTVYPKTRTVTSPTLLMHKTINKGDIWQVQDGGIRRGGSDLTGSIVTANKPVGLLSGHIRTAVPFIYNSKDHLIEMIPPSNTLGKRHVAVPFQGRQGGDLLRVIASQGGSTTVTFTTELGSYSRTLTAAGGYVDYDLQAVTVVTTSQPVLVTQYARSAAADPRNWNKPAPVVNFDPDMVVVTPEEQFVNGAIFHTLPNFYGGDRQYEVHYITVVAERENFETIKLNGRPLAEQPGFVSAPVDNTPYMWASMRVPDGSVNVLAGNALFGGYVYGLGSFDSYGWPIGARYRNLKLVDKNPPTLEAVQDCGGYTVTAREHGLNEIGLRSVRLDSSWSQNVAFDPPLVIIGDELAVLHVRLADPQQPGRARFIAEDMEANLDTIEIYLQPLTPLTMPESTVTIDNVVLGKTYRSSFYIKNLNDGPMTIDSLACVRRKEFLLDGNYAGKVIAPGDSLQVKVLFATTVRRINYDTVVVKSLCQYYRIPMVAIIGVPRIGTEDVDYGPLRLGLSRCLEVPVRNTGGVPLRVDSVLLQGKGFSLKLPFTGPITLKSGETVITPLDTVINPGGDTSITGGDTVITVSEEASVTVCFEPSELGPYTGTVWFYSDADSVAVAHLKGSGIYPKLSVGGYDFGKLQLGDDSCAMIPITNIGDDTAHVTGLALAGMNGFTVDTTVFPRDLAAGDTLWVPVCFTPDTAGSYGVDIMARNLDGLEAGDSLKGIGYVLHAAISGYDWKERWIFSKHDSVVFIRNLSAETLTIDSVRIIDGDMSDFRAEPPLIYPISIPAGESLAVPVQFSPMLAGFRSSIIQAWTDSRVNPTIDSVLQGFGLIAMSSDSLEFDSSLSYSCAVRYGEVTIYNDGNTPLTLADIALNANPNLVSWNPPAVGQRIDVGDSMVVNFTVDPAGYAGSMAGSISWRFVEIPDSIVRHFSLTTRPQEYSILAQLTPSVAVGSVFTLLVNVDSVFWEQLPRSGVTLRIEHNPSVARFDLQEWKKMVDSSTAAWRPVGDPLYQSPGTLLIRFEAGEGDPRVAKPLPLDSVRFIAFPFRGFLGNADRDTFRITMSSEDSICAPSCFVTAPYRLDSICGISTRLFEILGDGYALKQNAPNPSGDGTTIEFTLGMDAPTVLELFTSDGRLVTRLVDAPLNAGTHTVELKTRELPSGLYYYRLSSGPYGAVRQMVIAR